MLFGKAFPEVQLRLLGRGAGLFALYAKVEKQMSGLLDREA